MIATTRNRIRTAKAALLAGAVSLIVFSFAFTRLAGAREESKPEFEKDHPPVRLTVNDRPIQRDGKFVNSFAPVVKRVAPGVVNVFTTTKPKKVSMPRSPMMEDPFFRRFFGEEGPGRGYRTPRQAGLGSGVVVTEDGYILTNNHVVENADEIKVAFTDGKEYAAKVVGTDPKTDIAVLKIDADDLPRIEVANSDNLEVGDIVLALGNPFGVGQTVTMGMVSATGRGNIGLDYEDFIQTDAAINPGNSGGALVDAEGRLVGINTAILSRSGGNQGIGFAVPINLARSVMESLVKDGRVVRGFMGVNIQNVTPALAREFKLKDSSGALVAEVTPKSPAEKAGLQSGDVVVEFNGKPIRDGRHLKLQVAQVQPGSRVPVKILRDGNTRTLEVVLKEFPQDKVASADDQDSVTSEERLKGVGVADLDAATRSQLRIPAHLKGVLVQSVDEDSAAYAAGLRENDVIVEINRKPVDSAEEAVALSHRIKDDKILLRVWSHGGSRYLVVDESRAG
jgi:serine protease Do